jgi:hypothetical protein
VAVATTSGYALVHRAWKKGDVVTLNLPLDLRLENAAGSTDTVAVLRGPLVMAADLGPAEADWAGVDPRWSARRRWRRSRPWFPTGRAITTGLIRPADLTFVPFFSQYDRRSAVCFKRFSRSGWKAEQAAFLAEQARQGFGGALHRCDALGEMQPERDHGLTSGHFLSGCLSRAQRARCALGRLFRVRHESEAGAAGAAGQLLGRRAGAHVRHPGRQCADRHADAGQRSSGAFFDVDYPLPALTRGKDRVKGALRADRPQFGRAGVRSADGHREAWRNRRRSKGMIGAEDDTIALTLDEADALARQVLSAWGLAPDHAAAVAETMVAGSAMAVRRTGSIACWWRPIRSSAGGGLRRGATGE